MGSFTLDSSSFVSSLMSVDVMGSGQKNVDRAAQQLVSDIQRRAPVDTGELRAGYGYVSEGGGDRAAARVGTNVEHALYQEFGTMYHGAQPHFRPAIEGNKGEIIRIMGNETLREAFGGF